MMEAKRASSSANEVSISTFVSGLWARISRVASMPLPSASLTSITMTSGFVRSAWITASLTVPASATTRTSPAAPSIVLSPLRTTSWSSTSIRRRNRPGRSSVVSRPSVSTIGLNLPTSKGPVLCRMSPPDWDVWLEAILAAAPGAASPLAHDAVPPCQLHEIQRHDARLNAAPGAVAQVVDAAGGCRRRRCGADLAPGRRTGRGHNDALLYAFQPDRSCTACSITGTFGLYDMLVVPMGAIGAAMAAALLFNTALTSLPERAEELGTLQAAGHTLGA